MPGWPPGKPVDPSLKTQVLTILRRYWDALEAGRAAYLMPSIDFTWRHYQEEGWGVEAMRERLIDMDEYLNGASNVGWANTHSPGKDNNLNAGPGMNRLPDQAVIAMFQELDAIYAEYHIFGEAQGGS